MANLVWTGILYVFTFSIVFVAYKTFVNDRKYENELQVAKQVRAAQSLGRRPATAAAATATAVAAPGETAPAAPRRFTAPPRSARSNTIPANIRRA